MCALDTVPRRPSPPPHPSRRRAAHALDERRPAWKAGLIGTAAAHAVLVLVLLNLPADLWDADSDATDAAEAWKSRPFEIELSPELFTPREPPALEPPQFVEVNPAAPENVPDETPFVGAQNQQVAQPVPTPDGASDTPAVDGEGDTSTTAIVSGTNLEPAPPSASEILARAFETEESPDPREPEGTPPARAVNAPPGGEQLLGEADGGVGSTVTRLPPVPDAERGAEAKEGTASGTAPTRGYFSGSPRIDPLRPMERRRLSEASVNARATPTIKNNFGSKNIGAVSYSAKWSAYGEYLQRLIDAVQAQWERLILRSAFYPTAGSVVKVVFKIDDSGAISEIVRVEGSGGELAQRLCVSAIAERAPYGEWTEDMVAVLGEEQELTFTFHYQ